MGRAFWVARIVVGGSAAELGKGPGMIRLHMVHHEIIDLLRGNHLGDIAQELPGKGRLGSVDEGDLFSHHEISVVAHPMGQGPDPLEEVGGTVVHADPKDPGTDLACAHISPPGGVYTLGSKRKQLSFLSCSRDGTEVTSRFAFGDFGCSQGLSGRVLRDFPSNGGLKPVPGRSRP